MFLIFYSHFALLVLADKEQRVYECPARNENPY